MPILATAVAGRFPSAAPKNWRICDECTDLSAWGDRVRRFYAYWLACRPAPGMLPGRQHIDPLAIPDLISRLWMVDVVRVAPSPIAPQGLRFRYRLVGTREVETLQREVTGHWFDAVHARSRGRPVTLDRFAQIAEQGVATYRKGSVNLIHHKDHQIVENCMVPLATDGRRVDIIAIFSALYWNDGREA